MTLRGWDGERNVVVDAPEVPRRPSAKKDTKRWCLGKVGRQHVLAWERNARFNHIPGRPDHEAWWSETCVNCRKEFRYCYRAFGRTKPCACGRHKTEAA